MELLKREFSRKDVLKLSLLGSAALLLPLERVARTQASIANRLPESKLADMKFVAPFAIPPVLTKESGPNPNIDYYKLSMKDAPVQILPEKLGYKPTLIYGYN